MILSKEEKKLIRGLISFIDLSMFEEVIETYLDDSDPNKFYDREEPENYNDANYEVADNVEDRNGYKIKNILYKVLAE